MVRYYFDVRSGGCLSPDEEGMELPDLDVVQREASRAMGEIVREELMAAADAGAAVNMVVEVRTESGLVMRATFSFEMERLQ
jgi:hypothetical protein